MSEAPDAPMTWNYRLIHHDEADDPVDHWIGLHEAHYAAGRLTAWSTDAVCFVCDVSDDPAGDVRASLSRAMEGALLPVLRMTDLLAGYRPLVGARTLNDGVLDAGDPEELVGKAK